MKKLYLAGFLFLFTGGFQSFHAQSQTLDILKKQREVVKYKLDLLDKQIDLEKAKADRDKRDLMAQEMNAKAENQGADFSLNSDTGKASEEAKAAAKALKKAESANKSLEKSKDRIIDLEADIRKLESKLESARYRVEVLEK